MAVVVNSGLSAGDVRVARTPHTPSAGGRFAALDTMRGVAALIVLFFHLGGLGWMPGPRLGYLAVDLFFVLSGFVLAFKYDAQFANGLTPSRFVRDRFARLFPLYFVGFLFGLLWFARQLLHSGISLEAFGIDEAFNALMLPSPISQGEQRLYPSDSPAWSLFFELFVANATFAFCWHQLRGRALHLLIGIAALGILSCEVAYGSLDGGSKWATFPVGFVRVTFSFFLGVALSRMRRSTMVPKIASAFVLLPLIVILLPLSGSIRAVAELTLILAVFPAMVYLGSSSVERWPAAGRYLGEASFALYAVHLPILFALDAFFNHLGCRPGIKASLLSVALILLVSLLLSRWYDKPAQRLLRTLLRVRSSRYGQARKPLSAGVGIAAATFSMILVAAGAGYIFTAFRPPAYRPRVAASGCQGVNGYEAVGARTYLLRPDRLRSAGGAEYRALIAQADAALSAPSPAVTDQSALPSSGDRHDYVSLSTYSWPDPKRPGHSIWRDGEYNPATYTDAYDFSRLQALVNDGEALALAYHYTGEQRYAAKLAQNVRRWFIAPSTRMNPNLKFAQVDAVGALGDGNGTIDGWHFVYLIDAIGLIQSSHQLSSADMRALRQWFSAYLDWLQTSPQGRHELAATNNHALFYDLERVSFALFSGRGDVAHAVSLYAATHRLRQITLWGALPREESRAKPTHYMAVTAMAFTHLASVAECSGVDMWRAHGLNGGSIRSMINRMSRFADGRRSWPGGHPPSNGESLVGAFNEASFAYADPGLARLASNRPNQDYATDEDYRWGGLKGPR